MYKTQKKHAKKVNQNGIYTKRHSHVYALSVCKVQLCVHATVVSLGVHGTIDSFVLFMSAIV